MTFALSEATLHLRPNTAADITVCQLEYLYVCTHMHSMLLEMFEGISVASNCSW